MQDISCSEDGCTIATTGVCARTGDTKPCDHASLGSVEDQIAQHIADLEPEGIETLPPEISEPTPDGAQLYPGVELGLNDIEELMAEEYTHLVGILGSHNAGKTIFLVALYLICACGEVEDHGYAFAGSLTLPGFEDRARASRQWRKGAIPDRMSIHTRVTDDRSAGFMHLDLVHRASARRNRLLLSDLPGEWSTDLIKSVRYASRLAFLARSDAILIMIEGQNLANSATRHQEVERHKMLIDRVAEITTPANRRLAIVITKGDSISMVAPAGLDELVDHAAAAGFNAKGMIVASLSGDPDIRSGAGVFEVVSWAIASPSYVRKPKPSDESRPKRLFGWAPVAGGEMSS